jgi:predicted Rossmann fold flavoprotein
MSGERHHIVIIGGGGAGIIAAWRAAARGCPVLLLERNVRLGTKILISGGGKCNVTHEGTVDELLSAFLPRERRFLKPAFYSFSNADIQNLLASKGLVLAPRPNGRVFPVNGIAKDVMRAFSNLLAEYHVITRFHQRVEEVLADQGGVCGVRAGEAVFPTRQVILATGGASYPDVGTTGDGFAIAQKLGHAIVPVRAALAPIQVTPQLPRDWRGVAIRGASLSAVHNGREIASWQDDVLFTHEGLSGPATLEVSRAVAVAAESGAVTLFLDFFPGKSDVEIDAELQSMIRTQGARMVATLLEPWLPNRIIESMLHSVGVEPATRGLVLTREGRTAIVELLKKWPLGRVASVPLERGEVSAGGVALNEVHPHTMQSRRVKGFYLCGEVLDIAGPVGGYNLQAAFSTGYVAGDSAAGDFLTAHDNSSVTSI